MAISLKKQGLTFKEQEYVSLKYDERVVGRMYLDFLIDDKVIVELKKNSYFSKGNIDQVNQYLAASKLQLALLLNFSNEGVICKRLVNDLSRA